MGIQQVDKGRDGQGKLPGKTIVQGLKEDIEEGRRGQLRVWHEKHIPLEVFKISRC